MPKNIYKEKSRITSNQSPNLAASVASSSTSFGGGRRPGRTYDSGQVIVRNWMFGCNCDNNFYIILWLSYIYRFACRIFANILLCGGQHEPKFLSIRELDDEVAPW